MSRLVVCIVIIFSLSGCSSKLGNSIVRPFIVSMPDNDDVELLRSILMLDPLEFDSIFQEDGVITLEDSSIDGEIFEYHWFEHSDTISITSERYSCYKKDSFLVKRIYTFEQPFEPIDSNHFEPVLCRAGDITYVDSTESFKAFTTTLYISKDSTIVVPGDEFSTTVSNE